MYLSWHRDVWFAPGELRYTCTCMNGSQTQVVSLFCWVRVFFCCFWLILKSIFIKWDWCQYIDVNTILMLPFPTWSSTNILSFTFSHPTMQYFRREQQRNLGKVVLPVGAALHKSFFCPRLVLGLSSFVLFVFLLSLQCHWDALVMS